MDYLIGPLDRSERNDIRNLGLEYQILWALMRAGVRRVDALIAMTDDRLLAIRGIGPYRLRGLRMTLRERHDSDERGGTPMKRHFARWRPHDNARWLWGVWLFRDNCRHGHPPATHWIELRNAMEYYQGVDFSAKAPCPR